MYIYIYIYIFGSHKGGLSTGGCNYVVDCIHIVLSMFCPSQDDPRRDLMDPFGFSGCGSGSYEIVSGPYGSLAKPWRKLGGSLAEPWLKLGGSLALTKLNI